MARRFGGIWNSARHCKFGGFAETRSGLAGILIPAEDVRSFAVHRYRGILSALGSALLFGASTPLAKLVVLSAEPVLIAGLLYLGSGIGSQSGEPFAPALSPRGQKRHWRAQISRGSREPPSPEAWRDPCCFC
jgi:hypothetical protein